MLNVANCPRCGKLFNRGIKDVCPSCVQEVEKQYEKCYRYLRENRKASLQELSDATEVPIRQITKFIREGRISMADNPNLGYPCESCGSPIREGVVCESCRGKLSRDFANVSHAEELERRKEEERRKAASYNIREERKL